MQTTIVVAGQERVNEYTGEMKFRGCLERERFPIPKEIQDLLIGKRNDSLCHFPKFKPYVHRIKVKILRKTAILKKAKIWFSRLIMA